MKLVSKGIKISGDGKGYWLWFQIESKNVEELKSKMEAIKECKIQDTVKRLNVIKDVTRVSKECENTIKSFLGHHNLIENNDYNIKGTPLTCMKIYFPKWDEIDSEVQNKILKFELERFQKEWTNQHYELKTKAIY